MNQNQIEGSVKDVTGKIDAEKDIKQGRVSGKEYLIGTGQG